MFYPNMFYHSRILAARCFPRAARLFARRGLAILVGTALCLATKPTVAADATGPAGPNVVLLFADDLGYGDLGCFQTGQEAPASASASATVGASPKASHTPRLDRLAAEGVKLTNFHVAQAVCGASRAALLTGCYPNRLGLLGAPSHTARHGIHSDETTLAELLRDKGYATGMVGKWHLGHLPPFLPPNHGFDEYLGLPYSNDMWPLHPTNKSFPALPLIEGLKVVDPEVTADVQRGLTTRYTERAVDFIHRSKDRPFLLYVAYAMPHVPLFVSPKHAGVSGRGLYADVLREVDWSVGEILAALDQHGLADNTLVVFTSDNGPWLAYGDHAGSAGPLREGKGTAWEGGTRVPCLARWPGKIPAGAVCAELTATIDVLPTIAHLVGAKSPALPIDGRDIGPLLRGEPLAKSPHEAYFSYWGRELHAVQTTRWKLHFPHDYSSVKAPGAGGLPGALVTKRCGLELYDLANDVGETRDVAADHPEIVKELTRRAEAMREELGDALTNKKGRANRPAGQASK